MSPTSKRKSTVVVASVIAGVTAWPTVAAEQGLEEVVVTARKREENLQQVPLAITAMTDVELQRRSIRSLSDLAQNTPGVTFFDANTVLATPVIRGISQTVISAPDRNVGMYFNGVFLSNTSASDFNLFDMERIEVVKGPVSALYGRNAFAGAINYVPKQASLDAGLKGFVEATGGSQSRYGGRGSINLPVSDTLAIRLSAGYDEWDGSIRDTGGGYAGGYEATSAAWDIRWKPTDQLSVGQFGFWVDDTRELTAQFQFDNNCGQVAGTGTATIPARPSFYCGELIPSRTISIADKAYGSKRNGVVTGLDIDYDFGPVTASVIGGFTDLTQTLLADLDQTPDPRGRLFTMYPTVNGPIGGGQPVGTAYFHTLVGGGPETTRDMTWELRLASKQDQAFRWMVGASYYKHYLTRTNLVAIDKDGYTGTAFPWSSYTRFFNAFRSVGTDLSAYALLAKNTPEDESPAAYTSLGLDVTDKLTLSGDLRYDKEHRRLTNNLNGVVQKREDKYWTYRVSADYKLDPEKMVYASVAKGVIAGFFNGVIDAQAGNVPIPVSLQNYKPSSNITYEIGGKASWFDRRLTTNFAVFYIDYKDLQIQTAPPPPLIARLVTNAASATAKGFELTVDGRLTEHLTAGLGYGYVDPKYGKGTIDLSTTTFCGIANPPICTTDISGNPLTRASKNTANLYLEYDAPLNADWNWFARIDGRYQSKQYPRSIDLQWVPGYTIGNARVGFSKGDKIDVELWVKNFTDKLYIGTALATPFANAAPNQAGGGTDFVPSTIMGELRSYGLTARYRF